MQVNRLQAARGRGWWWRGERCDPGIAILPFIWCLNQKFHWFVVEGPISPPQEQAVSSVRLSACNILTLTVPVTAIDALGHFETG